MIEPIAFLSIDDVLESHLFQVETYGGDSGLRDAELLESAVAQPQASFGGEYLHAFPFEMAAAYLFHLVMNHPFVTSLRVGCQKDGSARNEACGLEIADFMDSRMSSGSVANHTRPGILESQLEHCDSAQRATTSPRFCRQQCVLP